MKNEKPTAQSVWDEYQRGERYNNAVELYDKVNRNENFMIGKQWEGVNAPDLPKPVLNIAKRVTAYFISMIVSDDVGVSVTPYGSNMEPFAKALEAEVSRVIELDDMRPKNREIVRNAAVDGDGFLYFYFDPDAPGGMDARGRIRSEVVDNTRVMFGNPYSSDLQGQPYILISQRRQAGAVRDEAKENGVPEWERDRIEPDEDADRYGEDKGDPDDLVTVVIRLWKDKDGDVWAMKSTQDVVVRKAWNLKYKRYPLSVMRWDKIKNSYHGQAAMTEIIPNQIQINQLFGMAIQSVKTNAFPRIFYDMSKIQNWTNRVGQAIGVAGNPNDAVASNFRGADMSAQVVQIIDSLTQKTMEFMGASDSALGNVKPDNTSAIIAVQKAAAMPLELQRMEFYRFFEDCVRVMVDIITTDYTPRPVRVETEDGAEVEQYIDYTMYDSANLDLKVDVGAASYWSELMQIQTLDNLFEKGILNDAVMYLEGIPDQYIKGKNKIIAKLKERQQMAEEQAAAQMGAAPGGGAAALAGMPAQAVPGMPVG